jgi:hypothetical protein
MLAATAALSGLLAVAVSAEDAVIPTGNANIDQQVPYQPDPKMMLRARGAASLTPGAEKRGLQAVDPAGPAAGAAIVPGSHDTPAVAAAVVTTDAVQMTPSSAAQTIRTQSR